MKKLFTATLIALSFTGLHAQTLLEEGFETGNTGDKPTPVASTPGWTVVNGYTGQQTKYNWHNYYRKADGDPNEGGGATITGNCCAAVDAALFTSDTEGFGPREEILMTPELNLDDTYELDFTFIVSPVNRYDDSRYDLQVRVVTDDNLSAAETVFSIQNEAMLRENGIMVFPIEDWSPHTAKVNLNDYKGQKVKLAFVYKMMQKTANVLYLDDVVVKKAAPITAPIAQIDMESYDFGRMYVGEKMYSEVVTLVNTGKDGLKINSVSLPNGVSLTIDPTTVNLDRYTKTTFQLRYEASLTSATTGNAVLHTNGGDVSIAIKAAKDAVPAGMYLETFEGFFPPAGWSNSGWGPARQALEGDRSVCAGGGYGASVLTSPKIDLTDGGKVTFTYFNYFDSDDPDGAPEYDVTLQVSYDGGTNWTTKWTSDYVSHLNALFTETVDLGYGDDNCMIRWFYPEVESDDNGAYPHSTFYLDRVLLPNLVGADGVPTRVKYIAPANGDENIYPQDVKLEWGPAQFAKGYKLYVGTNNEMNDLINGQDMGTALEYVIPKCAYSATYRWKVVAYNDKGDCSNPGSSRFSTQQDATVASFPYEQNFDFDSKTQEVPTGWTSVPAASYNRRWELNNLNPYVFDNKKYGVMYTTWLNPGEWNALVSPEFKLPEGSNMEISFIWGDEHPTDLLIDASGTVRKHNEDPDNGIDILYFDILDNGEWKELSHLSDLKNDDEKKYWINEKIDLKPYAGKTVQFRWRYESMSLKSNGASLTHVVVSENQAQKGEFNLSSWNAGKVNNEKAVNSGEIYSIINRGSEALTVKSATFGSPNFSTSLAAGDKIEVNGTKMFSMQFNALTDPKTVNDALTVEFEGGYKMQLPVGGVALDKAIIYHSFEDNPLDLVWDEWFTMIDADKSPNYHFSSSWVGYSADGQKCAFSSESDSYENGMYGMMNPVWGDRALVGACPQNTTADNWIISPKLNATESSKFDFYARNWETTGSVLPEDKHHVTVLVSTKDNPGTKDFEVVMEDTEMPYLGIGEWNHYEVDLGKYAGKGIYVALRHTTVQVTNLAFFDDFTFSNFNGIAAVTPEDPTLGVDGITADNASVEVYTAGGILVAKGTGTETIDNLAKGIYIVVINDADGHRTLKITK